MSIASTRKLKRLHVGALPLIRSIAQRIHLREILLEYIPPSRRQSFPRSDLLVLLVVNLTLAKDPLYELGDWVRSLDLRALGYDAGSAQSLSDDCFARALDKLYEIDRDSLLTRLVVSAIKAFGIPPQEPGPNSERGQGHSQTLCRRWLAGSATQNA